MGQVEEKELKRLPEAEYKPVLAARRKDVIGLKGPRQDLFSYFFIDSVVISRYLWIYFTVIFMYIFCLDILIYLLI